MIELEERFDGDPESIAEQQFMHGMLCQAHEDQLQKEERLNRAFRALDSEKPRIRVLRLVASLAAAALVLIGGLAVFTGGESAYALVRESVEAARTASNRRYYLEVVLTDTPEHVILSGELDIGDPEHMLLRMTTPHGREAVLGRDSESAWIAHPGVDFSRLDPGQDWPRWLRLDQSAVLVESIDVLLELLLEGYTLERAGAFEIIAHRKGDDDSQPERVELALDPETHLVRQMELSWPSAPHTVEDFQREVERAHATYVMSVGFLETAPSFDEQEFLAPRVILFELVESPDFPPDWFQPETHAR